MTAARPTESLLAPNDPRQLGPWKLLSRLGSGGMGAVYLGTSEGVLAAIKVIHPGLAQDPTFTRRFAREIAVSSRVAGPHVAKVLDADPDGDPPWLATEFIDGPTLTDGIEADGPLRGTSLDAFAAALISALQSIHAAGIIHRDLKPSNVILTPDRPVVIDFGIASASDETSFTQTGTALGSAGWMAPEQVEGKRAGTAADVYAWAGTVAFAATGRPPFGTGPAHAVLYRVVHHEPDLAGIQQPLAGLLERALAKDPQDRATVDSIARAYSHDGTIADFVAGTWVAPPEAAQTRVHPTPTSVELASEPTGGPARRILWPAAIAVVAAVFIALIAFAVRDNEGDTAASTDTVIDTTTTTPPATTTTSAPEDTTTTTATTTTTSTVPTTTSPPAPAEPVFSSAFGAATPDALGLLDFFSEHELETVRVNATVHDLSPEDLYRMDDTDVLFVPGTCDQFCEGDAYELLFRELDSVPDAAVYYDSGTIEIKGRFVVNSVQIQTGGVFSVALRAVPIA
ncbi:MAG TPA: serine/threonine-protein kinase [Acidimicrobiales bacterium]|nr:serine/threonine-protein kinase [Acidimicrobiales bacterium]